MSQTIKSYIWDKAQRYVLYIRIVRMREVDEV